jgi:hypothetical protein
VRNAFLIARRFSNVIIICHGSAQITIIPAMTVCNDVAVNETHFIQPGFESVSFLSDTYLSRKQGILSKRASERVSDTEKESEENIALSFTLGPRAHHYFMQIRVTNCVCK